jgi:hypothetical protein
MTEIHEAEDVLHPDARSTEKALDHAYRMLVEAAAGAEHDYLALFMLEPPTIPEDWWSGFAFPNWSHGKTLQAEYDERVRSARERYERAVETVEAFVAANGTS